MIVHTSVELDFRDVVRDLHSDDLMGLVLNLDLAVADAGFTMGLVKKLLESLEKDVRGEGTSEAYENAVNALDEFYKVGYD